MSGGRGSCDVAGEASRAGKPHAPDVGRSPARDGRGLLAPVHSALMWLPWLTATPRFQSTRGTWECPRHWAPLCPFRIHGHREKGPVCCLILCFPLMLPLLSSCSLQHSPALQDCSVLLYLFIYFFLENRATPRHPVQFSRVMPQSGLEKQQEDEVLPSRAVLYVWVV